MSTPQIRITLGGSERLAPLQPLPFLIGRRPTHPLALPLPQISRDHAQITCEGGAYVLSNLSQTHGTLVNGQQIERHVLAPGDTIQFLNCPGVQIAFEPPTEAASLFLTQFRNLEDTASGSDFERLRLLLDFGQRLRTTDVLDDMLVAMIDAAQRLTGAERGFVFLREGGELQLAASRAPSGAADPKTISRSMVERAAAAADPFIVNDRLKLAAADQAQSMAAFDLRTAVAIPLRDPQPAHDPVLGVLYLDSHAASPALSQVSRELLEMLADQAAQILRNAQLLRRQEAERLLKQEIEQELALAAAIQRGLMLTDLPALAFAQLRATNQTCKQIGGDFYDAVCPSADTLAAVLCDVSGKGAAAALLASTLQGIVHAQLLADLPLAQIAATANRFVCQRLQGEKYATLLIVRLQATGEFEYINCGHIQPLLITSGVCRNLPEGNLPIGLLQQAEYSSARDRLTPGARLLLVTDGVTEAANAAGDMFGDDRLATLAAAGASLETIAAAVAEFCQGAPLADDVTLVDLAYSQASPANPLH